MAVETFESNNFKIRYEHRKGTSDRRHLIVVFSGFRPRGSFDLHGRSADNLRCDILWIEDWFDTNHAYYITTGKGTLVASAVNSLIEKIRVDASLTKSECTMVGFSKGGTGALFQGLSYGYGSIVAVAPRMNFASANRQRNLDVFENITSTGSDEEVLQLDNLLPDLVEDSVASEINLYLFSSRIDYQYATEVEPFLEQFEKYKNFNLVMTDSPFVTDHIDVSRYNIPLVLSILTSLAERAVPKFGHVSNGDHARTRMGLQNPSLDAVDSRKEIISSFDALGIRDGKLFPLGVAFIRGNQALTYGSIQRTLILRSAETRKTFALGSLNDKSLSSKYFENSFCDYSKAKFASLRQLGVDLRGIPDGVYDIGLELKHAGLKKTIMSVGLVGEESHGICGESLVEIRKRPNRSVLIKQPLLSFPAEKAYFSTDKIWHENGRFHIEGIFAVDGQPAADWQDVQYFGLLKAVDSDQPEYVFSLAKDHKSEINGLINKPFQDYSKCYYTTPNYGGVSLPKLKSGKYRIFISIKTWGGIYTSSVEQPLVIV